MTPAHVPAPFVARLNPDGSYDRSFGSGGWTTPTFPCLGRSRARLNREGCLPTVKVKVRLRGLDQRRPFLSLRVRPREGWARIRRLTLDLPYRLRPLPGFRKRVRVVTVGGASERVKVRARKAEDGQLLSLLFFERLGLAREMRVTLPVGSLELLGRPPRNRELPFELHLDLVEEGGFERPGERVQKVRVGRQDH